VGSSYFAIYFVSYLSSLFSSLLELKTSGSYSCCSSLNALLKEGKSLSSKIGNFFLGASSSTTSSST